MELPLLPPLLLHFRVERNVMDMTKVTGTVSQETALPKMLATAQSLVACSHFKSKLTLLKKKKNHKAKEAKECWWLFLEATYVYFWLPVKPLHCN